MIHTLTPEQEKQIDDKFGPTPTAWCKFLLARAKYIAVCRLNGKDDLTISHEVSVELRDDGQHVRRIRESLDIP